VLLRLRHCHAPIVSLAHADEEEVRALLAHRADDVPEEAHPPEGLLGRLRVLLVDDGWPALLHALIQ